ncbi:MAG: hypothetical protein ACJAUZ_003078 [Flavobacteriaceae bacterium]|jgi:hypothetical protein
MISTVAAIRQSLEVHVQRGNLYRILVVLSALEVEQLPLPIRQITYFY